MEWKPVERLSDGPEMPNKPININESGQHHETTTKGLFVRGSGGIPPRLTRTTDIRKTVSNHEVADKSSTLEQLIAAQETDNAA